MAKKKAARKRSQIVTTSRGRSARDNALTAVSPDRVEGMILLLRGERVIPDYDLAKLYGVTTGRLNEQVRRSSRT